MDGDMAVQFATRLRFALGLLEDRAQAVAVPGRLPMPATVHLRCRSYFSFRRSADWRSNLLSRVPAWRWIVPVLLVLFSWHWSVLL